MTRLAQGRPAKTCGMQNEKTTLSGCGRGAERLGEELPLNLTGGECCQQEATDHRQPDVPTPWAPAVTSTVCRLDSLSHGNTGAGHAVRGQAESEPRRAPRLSVSRAFVPDH